MVTEPAEPLSMSLAVQATRVIPLSAQEVAKLPDWLRNWYMKFEKQEYGKSWMSLIHRWPLLEKGYGLISPIHLFDISSFYITYSLIV